MSEVADIAAEQREDPELLQAIKSLENGAPMYHLMEGVLCKKNYDPLAALVTSSAEAST